MKNDESLLGWAAIFRIITACLIIYLVWRLFDIILLIVVSMMLAAAFYPIVQKLQKKVSTTIATLLAFSLLLIPLVFLAISILPNLISQFPDILKTLDNVLNGSTILPPAIRSIDFTQYAQNLGSYLLQSTTKITSIVTAFLTVLFLAIYFVIDFRRLHNLILEIVPSKYHTRLTELTVELTKINGQYIRGNLLISLICGFIIFLGLLILQVPFAASLALFAAITDLLPLIGGIVGATPAVVIGFAISPLVGILVLALFFIYQILENNILSPNVYNHTLDISPALSFIAVIVGANLFGIIGAFIALPVAASIPTVIKYLKSGN